MPDLHDVALAGAIYILHLGRVSCAGSGSVLYRSSAEALMSRLGSIDDLFMYTSYVAQNSRLGSTDDLYELRMIYMIYR